MARMWLSHGIAAIPNSVWQFERPCPCSNCRWCARNDGLWAKKYRKRRQHDIAHRVTLVRPLPLVRQRGATLPQRSQKATQRLHPHFESETAAAGNPRQNENCWFGNEG